MCLSLVLHEGVSNAKYVMTRSIAVTCHLVRQGLLDAPRAQGIRTSPGTMCWMAYGTSSGRCRTRRSERACPWCSVIELLFLQKCGFQEDILCQTVNSNKLNIGPAGP